MPRGLRALVALACIVGALAAGYQAALTPVTLVVDGQVQRLRTHQDTVAALLMDNGLTLHPEDIVNPALDTTLEPGLTVEVQCAHPVFVSADGHSLLLRTHATSVEAVLQEARVSLGPHDEVDVEGELVLPNRSAGHSADALDLDLARSSRDTSRRNAAATAEPVRITVHRAIPFTLHEDGRATTLYTTASTVGDALRRAGLTFYLADGVRPGLGERLSAGIHLYVDRSKPVTVQADGRTLRTRTHRERVDEVLADLGIVLTGEDYTVPPLDAPLGEEATIRVVRVSERFLIEQEPIPFESTWQPDPDLEIDQPQRVLQEGVPGVFERRIRVRYEDGQEISRQVDSEHVAVPPTTKLVGYGTKIVVRTLDTPSGPIEYWRVIRMLATSYSAGTAGTPKTSPWYGRTATGMQMRHGIVAVDPRVINLRSQVYVPGYGVGIAGDTGGGIKGRRIDLGYDDDNLVLWYRWVDVYLLTPVPSRIDYILD
ncbi:MAG TPA: ubiquitin-like domain-containing protein [Anaerolineae bacterium]|nr:ubiquitin-like domain-containing protein [Anaerolineae bacterium]